MSIKKTISKALGIGKSLVTKWRVIRLGNSVKLSIHNTRNLNLTSGQSLQFSFKINQDTNFFFNLYFPVEEIMWSRHQVIRLFLSEYLSNRSLERKASKSEIKNKEYNRKLFYFIWGLSSYFPISFSLVE